MSLVNPVSKKALWTGHPIRKRHNTEYSDNVLAGPFDLFPGSASDCAVARRDG